MKQYDSVFKGQLQTGVIEEVSQEREVVQTNYLLQRLVIRSDIKPPSQ